MRQIFIICFFVFVISIVCPCEVNNFFIIRGITILKFEPLFDLQEFVCADDGCDSARIQNLELVRTISELLCLESPDDLAFALTTLRSVTRGSVHSMIIFEYSYVICCLL